MLNRTHMLAAPRQAAALSCGSQGRWPHWCLCSIWEGQQQQCHGQQCSIEVKGKPWSYQWQRLQVLQGNAPPAQQAVLSAAPTLQPLLMCSVAEHCSAVRVLLKGHDPKVKGDAGCKGRSSRHTSGAMAACCYGQHTLLLPPPLKHGPSHPLHAPGNQTAASSAGAP